MTTTTKHKSPMDTTRKAALAAGLFYNIGTFVFSIPALGLYKGVLDDHRRGAGGGPGLLVRRLLRRQAIFDSKGLGVSITAVALVIGDVPADTP